MSKFAPNLEQRAPCPGFRFRFGDIAQLVEQMTFNHWVQGSSPCVPTRKIQRSRQRPFNFSGAQGRRTRGKGSTMSKRARLFDGQVVTNAPQSHALRGRGTRSKKADGSMPVCASKFCKVGEANPCVPTKICI